MMTNILAVVQKTNASSENLNIIIIIAIVIIFILVASAVFNNKK